MRASPDAAIEALARQQHGAFSLEQARTEGVSAQQVQRRLAAGRWLRAAAATYVLVGWPPTFRQRAMVACLHAGPGAFASHRCAALLRRMDAISSAAVEITVPRRLRSIPNDVRVHYSTDATVFDWSVVDAIPTASVTRTIMDLCATTDLLTLERLFECGQRRRETSFAVLEETVERLGRSGKRGTRRARQLLATLVRDGNRNASDAETLFFQILRAAGLPLPTRQRVVLRPDGALAFADYAYDGIDAVLEVLGYEWHGSSASLIGDAERNNDLNLLGKTVIEFTWHHLTRDTAYVRGTVQRLLRDNNIEYRC